MKVRIISGLVAAIFLFFVTWAEPFVLGLAVFILSITGLFEFYQSVSRKGYKPIRMLGFFTCAALLIYSYIPTLYEKGRIFYGMKELMYNRISIYLLVYVVILYLLCLLIFRHDRYSLEDIAITLLGILYIPFLFSFVIFLRNMENGASFVWFAFIGAWGTDICAYFGGRFFGKHKLLPKISPNKTVEGFIGGFFGALILTVSYGIFYVNVYTEKPVLLVHLIVIGIMTGAVSQLGDWSASAIKRSVGIKDFGNIIPGHGGILDRCDSLLFVAPAVYFYLTVFVPLL